MASPKFNLYTHWRKLDDKGRKSFVATADTSARYIEIHLIHRRKMPKKPLIDRLAKACNATGAMGVTAADLVLWFYGAPKRRRRASRSAVVAA